MQLNHKLLAFYLFSVSAKKSLPERVIGAYVNRCDEEQIEKILQSVEDGLNVIFWFAGQIYCEDDNLIVTFPVDAQCIRNVINSTPDSVVHFMTIGTWNSPLPLCSNPEYWWMTFDSKLSAFEETNGFRFDGIDWDLEGIDVPSEKNQQLLTQGVLDIMLSISTGTHEKDRLVSIVPAESYFTTQTSDFNYNLNNSPVVPWHQDFGYAGRNCYSYLVAKNQSIFDLVTIQLYEGWSSANYFIADQKTVSAEKYIRDILHSYEQGHLVDFSMEKETVLPSTILKINPSKIAFGLANGWTKRSNTTDKFLLISPQRELENVFMMDPKPRGFVYWVHANENQTTSFYGEEFDMCMTCEIRDISSSSDHNSFWSTLWSYVEIMLKILH